MNLAEQITCVRREIRYRERVYPRRVANGNMTPRQMDHELAAMRAVLATLEDFEAGRVPAPERLL